MLRPRLITTLTFQNGILFRTKNFQPDYRYTANFVDAWSIDEVVLLDITRPEKPNRSAFLDIIRGFAQKAFVPICAGGNISSLDDVHKYLREGADKVSINTKAIENPKLITDVATHYGSQCAVVSIDAKKREDGSYEVFTNCGRNPTGMSPVEWAKEAEKCGAGEILLTSIDRDGSLEGYDNILNKEVAAAVKIPVIVSGGAGKWQDFVDGFKEGRATAVSTSNIYHFTETSIRSAKAFLVENGIQMRMS